MQQFKDPWGHEFEITEEQARGNTPIICFRCGRTIKLEDNRLSVPKKAQSPIVEEKEDES